MTCSLPVSPLLNALSRLLLMPMLIPGLMRMLAVMLTVTLVACDSGESATANYFHQVRAEAVTMTDSYLERRAFPGRVEAPQRIDIGFDARGEVIEVMVDTGDVVIAGETLAMLDSRLLDAERLTVIAQNNESHARLKLVGLELDRQHRLRKQGFSAEQKIDQLLAEKEGLLAQIDRISAMLVSVDRRLEKMILKAPFSGRVAKRFVDPGVVVDAGSSIVRVLQGGSIELHVGVPVELARHLRVGDEQTVVVESMSTSGIILAVNSAVSPATQTIAVKLSLAEQLNGSVLFDGQIARLIVEQKHDVAGFWVPVGSLLGGLRGTWNVMVLATAENTLITEQNKNSTDDGAGSTKTSDKDLYKIVRRNIDVAYINGKRAYIQGEFRGGEKLVVAGVHRLAVNQLVQLEPRK